MALKKITRRRAPLDGSWFRTLGHLDSILRAESRHDDDMRWPKFCTGTWVPIWVRMEKYKAQETREHPDGMIYGPIIRIGDFCSPEIELFGHHNQAGLHTDYDLDGLKAGSSGDKWVYLTLDGDTESGGEDVSMYVCSKCEKGLYRDDLGVRVDRSACLMDGELVCRDCDWVGPIMPQAVRDRLAECRKLADYVGPECRRSLEYGLERCCRTETWGHPSQTRISLDCEWSFFWSDRHRVDGEWKRGLVGGLIMHGPTPTLGDDGSFAFTKYDYGLKAVRAATEDEVKAIRWTIHT